MTKLLPPQELDNHRAKIGLRLEVLVRKTDKFGWDRMDPNIRTILRRDWMDALQDFTLDEIDVACRAAIVANPDKCPNEGHVRALIVRERDRIRAAIPKPVEEPYSALDVPSGERKAAAQRIMGEVFKTMGGAA